MKPAILPLVALSLAATAQAVTINVGSIGTAPGVNNWPLNESPEAAIDGVGQKYLNFGEINTGVVVTPSTPGTNAIGMTLWTANDVEDRDPASYQVWGTNAAVSGPSFDSSLFTLISQGALALPSTRNPGGALALDPVNSQTVSFLNSTAFDTYMILFPTVKNEAGANSMQIAEIQLNSPATTIFTPGDTILGVQASSQIPEPSTGLLALLGATAFIRRRRS